MAVCPGRVGCLGGFLEGRSSSRARAGGSYWTTFAPTAYRSHLVFRQISPYNASITADDIIGGMAVKRGKACITVCPGRSISNCPKHCNFHCFLSHLLASRSGALLVGNWLAEDFF